VVKREAPKKEPESELVEQLLAETALASAALEKEDEAKKAALEAKDLERYHEIKKK